MPKVAHRRVVVPHPQGWQVQSSAGARASLVTPSKSEAVGRALEILRNLGGGELIVHDASGEIADSDTVAPEEDAYPLPRVRPSS